MLTLAPVTDPAAVVLLPDAGWIELLALALLAALGWVVVERHRHRVEAGTGSAGRSVTGTSWRLRPARCAAPGWSPEHSPTPMHEAHRGDLR